MSFLYKCAISLDLFAYRWLHNESVTRVNIWTVKFADYYHNTRYPWG